MIHRESSQDKEILALIERFEEVKGAGKTPYFDAEEYEDIVEFYMYNMKLDKAMEATEMGLRIHPDDTHLTTMQVVVYITKENLEEARRVLTPILNSNDLHIRLTHIQLLAAEGKGEKALEILRELKNEENDDNDCYDIGVTCFDVGFVPESLEWLEKSLSINPNSEYTLQTLCDYYQFAKDYDKTVRLYNKLIDKDPYEPEYWTGLARSYFHMGQYNETIDACDFAIVSNESYGEAYAYKAHAYCQLENFLEAIEYYKKALKLRGLEEDSALTFIAFSYIGLEDWNNAYDYLQKVIPLTEEKSLIMVDLLINSARCAFNLGKREEAHKTLEHVQELRPDNANAYIYSGAYYLKENKRDKAIEYFSRATTVADTADTWYQIAIWAASCEDFRLAIVAFDQVKRIEPNYDDLNLNISFAGGYRGPNEPFGNIISSKDEDFNLELISEQARLEGKSEKEIEELRSALDYLNNLQNDSQNESQNVDNETEEIE